MRRARHALFILFLLSVFPALSFAEGRITDQWMEILMNGRKIGFSHQRVTRTKAGYTVEGKALMRFEMQGTTQDISTSQTYFLDASFHPIRYTYMQKMLNNRQFFEGVVEGKKMRVTVKSAGNVTHKTIDMEEGGYIADAVGLLLGSKKLREGDKYTYKVFIEPLLAYDTMLVEVGKEAEMEYAGKKEKVFPVTMRLKSFHTVSYITMGGRVLREVSPMGFVSQAVDEAQAIAFPQGAMSFTNLLAYSLIPLEKPLENASAISALDVRITGLSSSGLIPQDDRQKVTGAKKAIGNESDTWTIDLSIRANDVASVSRLQRPAGDKFAKEMEPSIEAQSDDPDIARESAKIVGGEKDMFAAAVKINRWVYENVKKKYIDTFSAVATLKTMEGECQSHTNLFAALARAAGIPTRTVSGIVYSQEYGGFLYHAWAEVYAGKWIAMDPTFGQDMADATHIKLTDGELSSQMQLFEFIGKIGVEVVSTGGGK